METKEAVLPGWARALSYAAPLAGGAALGATLPAVLRQKEPEFSSEEQREFTRHGIDPKTLGFYKTLGGLMRGLRMQRQFMEMAMQGRPEALEAGGAPGNPLEQYA
jgi:hypothetical protein